MSKLYKELRDVAVQDATVYHFLKQQNASDNSDLETAIQLIRQLAKEKKAFFDDAVNTRNLSVVPFTMISSNTAKKMLKQDLKALIAHRLKLRRTK